MRSGRDTLRHRDSPGGVKWGGTRVAFKTRPHGHKLFRSVRPSPLFHPAVIKAAPSGGHRGRYFHATAGCLLQRLASPRPPSRCSGRSLVLIESKQLSRSNPCVQRQRAVTIVSPVCAPASVRSYCSDLFRAKGVKECSWGHLEGEAAGKGLWSSNTTKNSGSGERRSK